MHVVPAITRAGLVIVDFQNDFCPGGALGVPGGGDILPVVENLIATFAQAQRPIAFTQDFHPADHISFAAQGGPWPPHCVQGTPGAALYAPIAPEGAAYFYKGFLSAQDAYSGFEGHLVQDGHITQTMLGTWLKDRGVDTVYIAGLATDYCVRATALDAVAQTFHTRLVENAVRGVDVHPGDSDAALQAMRGAGVALISWELNGYA